ncbi:YbbR-like protein [Ulvibacter sp. MAR_2010_11]|uniref:CdaR family protein n=1 Tax=Ulvibacter sp. MAR_2010_11 TaxID=1250229 RepID=UPI000C2CE1D2|nr:YbbR-like domain-containing protein [Ulvibacter sp. MAR_2010_11]PKA84622.1 YbbR-like protein [Ulvibacter sp. MAR_2010_11]
MLFKRRYKATKIKTFLFFLFLAILFWSLSKLSKEYTATVNATILYSNVPENMVLDENNPKEISFDVTANGFEFVTYKLRQPSVKLDVASHHTKESKSIIIPKSSLIKTITVQLQKNISIKNISVDDLTLKLSEVISKKIPVIADTKITFKEGFNSLDSLRIHPDSIVISGPESILKDISSIATKRFEKEKTEQDIKAKVSLLLPANKKITIIPSQVELSLKVNEFSQMQITVPMEVINIPSKISIKLIPQVVRITFIVSVEDFNNITSQDFKIVCDYSERNTVENFMTPILVTKPKSVLDVELIDKKIDYLIFK